MAATLHLANATQQAACDSVVDLIDGTGDGTITIYSGTQPANANTAPTGGNLVLATLTFQAVAFGAANTSGVATVTPSIVGDTSADTTGTATWARIADSAAATVFDCNVGTTDETIIFDSVSFVTGGTVDITAFTVTHPDGV